MATAYEWVVEEMDGEDIEDTHCFDSLKEAKTALGPGDCLALRKMKSNRDADSVDSFAYAYMDSGKLPEKFDDGSFVPARYLREAAN